MTVGVVDRAKGPSGLAAGGHYARRRKSLRNAAACQGPRSDRAEDAWSAAGTQMPVTVQLWFTVIGNWLRDQFQ